MNDYRVWEYGSCDYVDVKGKNIESVARRFFGKSKYKQYHHNLATDIWTIVINGRVQGTIKEYENDR